LDIASGHAFMGTDCEIMCPEAATEFLPLADGDATALLVIVLPVVDMATRDSTSDTGHLPDVLVWHPMLQVQ